METELVKTLLWIGIVLTIGTVGGGSALTARGRGSDLVDIGGGLLSVLVWGLVGFGAMNIERVVGSSVETTTEPALAYFAVVMAGVMLLFALLGSARLLDVVNRSPRSG